MTVMLIGAKSDFFEDIDDVEIEDIENEEMN